MGILAVLAASGENNKKTSFHLYLQLARTLLQSPWCFLAPRTLRTFRILFWPSVVVWFCSLSKTQCGPFSAGPLWSARLLWSARPLWSARLLGQRDSLASEAPWSVRHWRVSSLKPLKSYSICSYRWLPAWFPTDGIFNDRSDRQERLILMLSGNGTVKFLLCVIECYSVETCCSFTSAEWILFSVLESESKGILRMRFGSLSLWQSALGPLRDASSTPTVQRNSVSSAFCCLATCICNIHAGWVTRVGDGKLPCCKV